jgi:preprotein translocase subunit SecB
MDNKSDQLPENQPQVIMNAQYAKDVSFESPNSPLEFINLKTAPKIDLSLDILVKNLEADSFEVALKMSAKATHEDKTLFVSELEYAGVFNVKNVEKEEQREQILLIYCPNLLFPFARRIISDLTRDGGYQPLMVNPIDFAALYLQQKHQQVESKANGQKPS